MTDDEMALAALLARTERARARLERDNDNLHLELHAARREVLDRPKVTLPGDVQAFTDALIAGDKIAAIKAYRNLTGAHLVDAKNAVEATLARLSPNAPAPTLADILRPHVGASE